MKKSADGNIWEKTYADGEMLNKYPFDQVVSIVLGLFGAIKDRSTIRILDLGCGAGNNSWFLAKEGFDVVGIDVSESALNFARDRIRSENLSADFIKMPFNKIDQLEGKFDLVLDREALYAVDYEDVVSTISKVHSILNNQGIFLSFFYNKNHPYFLQYGGKSKDGNTFYEVSERAFSKTKKATLLDTSSHSKLFADFKVLECYEHMINPIMVANDQHQLVGISEFITIAKKVD